MLSDFGLTGVRCSYNHSTSKNSTTPYAVSRIESHVLLNDDCKVISQYKWYSLPLHAKLALEVPQKVSKVDMKELSVFGDHDVVRVAISYPEHIRGHTVPSTGMTEVHPGSVPSEERAQMWTK